MQPSDYLFCIDDTNDPGNDVFCFTSKEYWDENDVLDDCLSEIDCLPPKFHNLMEAMWEYAGASTEEGKQNLLDAGFVFSSEMDSFINNR